MAIRSSRLLGRLLPAKTVPCHDKETFFVWEPCSHSHAEVLPGYAKLLLDAGYKVSVLVTPERLKEGLFSQFHDERLKINCMSQRSIRRFFAENGLADAAGIIITTAGKLAKGANYEKAKALFGAISSEQRILLVEHDVKEAADLGTLTKNIITLSEINYKNAETTPVNPHYFGDFETRDKNESTVFLVIGASRKTRKNLELLVKAVDKLQNCGVENFKIIVAGKPGRDKIPHHLQQHIKIVGRLDFSELYKTVEHCDFMLPLLDPEIPEHYRYITTGTSGTFQLSLGFCKPCIIEETFGVEKNLKVSDSILYKGNDSLVDAMQQAINMTKINYASMRNQVRVSAKAIHQNSLDNLKALL